MAKIYYEKDANLDALKGKTVAVIGYGNQGHAQALNLRDSGVNVIIGARKNGNGWKKASQAGFEVFEVSEASKKADVIHILIPDEIQGQLYKDQIAPGIESGNALSFSHGFNIRFGQIKPPKDVDVFMIAPKGPGTRVRTVYEEGFGVPALVAIEQDATGNAKGIALAFAKGLGATRAGVIETTFTEETETDLFGEQVDLCGGVTSMIDTAFETLVKNGYQPEIAYFEVLHELKLITDLIQAGGEEYMWTCVSNTAEYGGRTRGKRIINEKSKKAMQDTLDEIKSGKFAEEWINEYKTGLKNLTKMREEGKNSDIEKVGGELRKMFERK